MRTENDVAANSSADIRSAQSYNGHGRRKPVKDIELNLTYSERGMHAFMVIAGAFVMGATQWLFLIPILFYLWFSALTGFSITKAFLRTITASKNKRPGTKTFRLKEDDYQEAA